MSTAQHTVPAASSTNTYDKTGAHPTTHGHGTTSSAFDKSHAHGTHHNEHAKDEFAGNRGTTSSADNLRNDGLVKTGGYTTGLEAASGIGQPAGHAVPVTSYNQGVVAGGVPVTNVPTGGAQIQNTVPNAANRDGMVVNDGLGGARGGAAVLGAQCECTMNGGQCQHGAGACVCRGCTTKATTINPGINIGVSTTQYTAPAGTTGIGGGVAEYGTGIAGLMHTNTVPSGRPVDAAHQNCVCVKKNGVCGCAPGQCSCTNCTALRASREAEAKAHHEKEKAKDKAHHEKDKHHHGSDKDAHHSHHHDSAIHGHHHSATATGAAAATGATAAGAHHRDAHHGAPMTTYTSTENVDGPGVQNLTMTSSNMTGARGYAVPAASTSAGSTNAYAGQSALTNKSPESVIAGSEYASGNVHASHVNRGAASGSAPHDPSIERGTASSPRPITDNSPLSYLGQSHDSK